MTKLIVEFGLFGDIGVVDAKLSLSNKHVSIPEVDQQIAIVCFEPVFDSQHLELLSVFGGTGGLHLLQQLNDLLRSVPLDFASEKVVDVKNELLPDLSLFIELGQLQEQTDAIDHDLVSCRSNGALEEEVVDD